MTAPLVTRVEQEIDAGHVTVDVAAVGYPSWVFERAAAGDALEYDSPQYRFYADVMSRGLGRTGFFAFNGAYLVGTLYLPFGRTGFEAFADGGGLVMTGETPSNGGFTRWSSGFRADAGLIYDITPVLGIRAAYRFQTPLAHMTAETIGFTYSF